EEIINALAQIDGLRVTSRTSSFYFKNKNLPIRQIGRALKVSTILEGSIRLAGNKMRITAQLIDVEEDDHFWSERFDRSVDDLFAVQEEVSHLIADKLREHLGHFELDEALVRAPAVSTEAYQRYLQGRYHLLKMTQKDLDIGMRILRTLVEEHPDFALAHLGIHLGYTLLGTIGLMPAGEAFTQGQPFLDQAIALDDNLPECQLQLAYIAFLQEWNLDQAYAHLNQSFAIRPTVDYYQSMASVLVAERKFSAATNYINMALQLDPFSAINYHLQGFIFYVQAQYEKAMDGFRKALELNPHFMAATLYLGQAMLLKGELLAGLTYFEQLSEETQKDLVKTGGSTLAYAANGQIAQAEAGIAELEAKLQSEQMERAINFLILVNALLGRLETTLLWIEKGIAYRLPMLVYLSVEPMLRPLSTHARYQSLMQSVLGVRTKNTDARKVYQKTLLTSAELQEYRQKLETLMEQNQPYLQPDLSLLDLATMLELPPNYVSQLLNQGFDQNFSEYVNTYRLATFQAKAADPSNRQYTILAMAYESGFNSKTVFNSFFKKRMGQTPSTWWKTIRDR
ncbi:MAG: helix-turn-helix domain-containing protein, partial [Bacteroidota bacterium]